MDIEIGQRIGKLTVLAKTKKEKRPVERSRERLQMRLRYCEDISR